MEIKLYTKPDQWKNKYEIVGWGAGQVALRSNKGFGFVAKDKGESIYLSHTWNDHYKIDRLRGIK